MLNLLQDIQSRLDKLSQNVSNLLILILRHTGCNDIALVRLEYHLQSGHQRKMKEGGICVSQ